MFRYLFYSIISVTRYRNYFNIGNALPKLNAILPASPLFKPCLDLRGCDGAEIQKSLDFGNALPKLGLL